jgi:hypothetical protein
VPTVVPAEGAILQRIVASTSLVSSHGLSRAALLKYEAARTKTAWALRHVHRFALTEGDEVLATAERHDLTGMLEDQPVTICGIGAVFKNPAHGAGDDPSGVLVERLLEDATRDGADLALCPSPHGSLSLPNGFEVVPTVDIELGVPESRRPGAPMTLVRGGEDRDLDAIAAMGRVRARAFRFHLDRDVDLVKHAITTRRLLAGLGTTGVRQLEFAIAEEGITAAAYVVVSMVGGTWTIEECGDRDASGARVGALLQALIAREPVQSRPIIQGWLPPGFRPPQVTIAAARPAAVLLGARPLSARCPRLNLDSTDVLYWRSDLW